MYKCNCCDKEYDELPKSGELYVFEDGLRNHEMTTTECECGGYLEEMTECQLCGCYFVGFGNVCQDCKETAYSHVIDLLYDNFDRNEAKYILENMIKDLEEM